MKHALFHHSLSALIIYFVVITSSIFLGGNRVEYIAFLNIILLISFVGIIWQDFRYIHQIYKILILPIIFLSVLWGIGLYNQSVYLEYSQNISSTNLIAHIIKTGIYAPFKHMWGVKYWISIFCLTIMAYCAGQRKGFKRHFIKLFFGFSVVIGLYGLVVYAVGNDSILWFNKEFYLNDLTATFVNRNSYAIFCGCGILSGLYLIINNYRIFSKQYVGHNHKVQIAKIIDYCLSHHVITMLMTFFLFGVLLLTHSRAGIILTLLFCGMFYFLTSYHQNFSQKLKILLFILVGLLCVSPIIMQSFLGRAVHLSQDADLRLNVYTIIFTMIADYPIWGIGLGGFEYAFQAYRDASIDIIFYWDKAHSTFLELCLELGIIQFSILILLYISVFVSILKAYLNYKSSFIAVCLMICGLILTHSAVDFSLQIPAINILFHIILSLAYAESKKSDILGVSR